MEEILANNRPTIGKQPCVGLRLWFK